MQGLHWKIPACPQGTGKLSISLTVAGRQVKKNSVIEKKREKKGENRQIVPDDIHVIINLVCSRQLISALRKRKDSHKIKLI